MLFFKNTSKENFSIVVQFVMWILTKQIEIVKFGTIFYDNCQLAFHLENSWNIFFISYKIYNMCVSRTTKN